jgi:hypothetical protein
MASKQDATEAEARVGNRVRAVCRGLAAAILVGSCARGEARFEVRQASDVAQAPLTVSLLGVYENGGMNAEMGADFARDVSSLLGPEPCVAGFNQQLQVANPEGFALLQAEAESRGLDEELLGRIAPAANGDLILAIDMSGRLTTGEDEQSSPSPEPKAKRPTSEPDPSAPHRGGGFGRHSPPASPSRAPQRDLAQPVPDLEVSASFYSVRLQRTVSSVNMRYSGSSLDDGLRQLAEKLAELLPHAVCRPWSWEHVRVVHERDAAGLPLPLFHLVRTEHEQQQLQE